MKVLLALILVFGSLVEAAAAPEVIPGPVTFDVVRVYDGDTFTVHVHPWPGMTFETAIRVRGIDTPELHTARCESASKLAVAARDFTADTLSNAKTRVITNLQEDKYGGRVDANVYLDGKSLAETLVAKGLAKPYNGGVKTSWCP